MQLTKTNFIQYLNCPESLWLLKNKPNEYPNGEFSLFLEKLISEGYEVEEYAKQLFSTGINISESGSPEHTKSIIESDGIVFFQPAFETFKGAFARVDILERKNDMTWHLYEVKSSSSIKTDNKHNHLKDACFQKYVLEECGYTISQVSIIHINKEYIKNGDIESSELLKVVEVTDDLNNIYSATANEINSALNFINTNVSITNCSCVEKTRNNHCDAFSYFNPEIENHSIYEINRISRKKISELRELGVIKISDIPADYKLSEKQQLQVDSNIKKEPIYKKGEIKNTLSALKFPLHFIDYETYPTAIPKVDKLSPHQHLTFQVSIHTLTESGNLSHYEYLADKMELPDQLIQFMMETTGLIGTFISWHASFEKGRNSDMIALFPEYENYLNYMNANMFDLETLFNTAYMDYRFLGKTSIKNVLPVLNSEFSYNHLEIQNGTMALDTWGRLVLDPDSFDDIEMVRKNLLAYCKLDTLAMVKIYQKLIKL